jgi:transposase-like protein
MTAAATPPTLTRMRLDALIRDERTQPREHIDIWVVSEYAEAMERGETFPPVVAFGTTNAAYLADGWHRVDAVMHREGWDDEDADHTVEIEVDLRPGGLDEAIWHAASANATHGLRRSNADKRRAVELALHARADLSNVDIARHCGVDEKTVRSVRAALEQASEIPKVTERRGADGKVYSTEKIGARPSTAAPEPVVVGDVTGEIADELEASGAFERVEDEKRARRARSIRLTLLEIVSTYPPGVLAEGLGSDELGALIAECDRGIAWLEGVREIARSARRPTTVGRP